MKPTLVVLVVAVLVMAYYNQKLVQEFRGQRQAMKSQSAEIDQVRAELQHEILAKAHRADVLRGHMAEIQRQIQQKTTERDSLAASMQAMKNLSAGTKQVSAVKWDLDNKNEQIDKLEAQIKNIVARRQALEQQQKLTASQSRAQKQQVDLQFDRQIEAQREKLAKMQSDYSNFKSQKFDLTAQENARRLGTQIKDEQATLEQLKIKKRQFDLSGVAPADSPEIASDSAYLKNEEARLRDELGIARADYQTLQSRMAAAKSETISEHSEISTVQAKIVELDAAIKGLNGQVQADQRELQSLQTPGPPSPAK